MILVLNIHIQIQITVDSSYENTVDLRMDSKVCSIYKSSKHRGTEGLLKDDLLTVH